MHSTTIKILTHKNIKALNLGLNKFGRISMAMCLPSIIATGAPTKTSQTIEYFAISSDQVRESFKTYLKNTWIIITITINKMAIHAS